MYAVREVNCESGSILARKDDCDCFIHNRKFLRLFVRKDIGIHCLRMISLNNRPGREELRINPQDWKLEALSLCLSFANKAREIVPRVE